MTLQRIALATLVLTASATVPAKDLSRDELAALEKAGTILPREKLEAAALAKHPGGKIEDGGEVEKHRRGYVFEVEVTDSKGNEWDMDIDATSGKVLRDEED